LLVDRSKTPADQDVPRSNLLNALENGLISDLKISADDAFHVPFRLPAQWQECFHLCRHHQFAVMYGPKQGLDPISISNGKEKFSVTVVQADAEFTPDMRHEGKAVVFVQCEIELRVRCALE
jgi:hypothetical protein